MTAHDLYAFATSFLLALAGLTAAAVIGASLAAAWLRIREMFRG